MFVHTHAAVMLEAKKKGGEITFVWEVPREVRDFLTQLQHNSALKVVVVGGQTILCSGGSSGGGLWGLKLTPPPPADSKIKKLLSAVGLRRTIDGLTYI